MLTPVRAHTGMVRTNAAVHRRFYHNRLWEKETLIAVGYSRDHLVRPVQTDLDNRSFRAGAKDNPVRRRHLSTKERGAPGHTCHGIGPRMTHAQPHLPSVTTKEENNTDARVVSEKQLSQSEQSFISAGKHGFFSSLGFHWCLCVDVTVWCIP